MTKKEYANLVKDSEQITLKAKELLAKFNELNLTPSLNKVAIETEYKTQLFSKLLRVDKGLKFKYDLHRTEESKTKLINETINLDGYDVVDELMIEIENYKSLTPHQFQYTGINSENFLLTHKGDVHSAFWNMVTDVTDTELYTKLKPLEQLINTLIQDKAFGELNVYNTVENHLRKLFTYATHTDHTAELNEGYIKYLIEIEAERQANIKNTN